MKLLVLGSGFIGNYILNNPHKKIVHLVKRSDTDYTDQSKLKTILQIIKPAVVINCFGYAGKPNVDSCESNKETCWRYNVTVPPIIADTCKSFGVPFIHLSSGCIYEGDRLYTELDTPNFGLFENHSSFYSKTKHAGEIALEGKDAYIFRLRMPFCSDNVQKNILTKLLKYDNITNNINSMTSVDDLVNVIHQFCDRGIRNIPTGIYNIVNEGAVTTAYIVQKLKEHGLKNDKWMLVNEVDLKLACRRSNCSLSNKKLIDLGIEIPTLIDSIQRDISILKQNI